MRLALRRVADVVTLLDEFGLDLLRFSKENFLFRNISTQIHEFHVDIIKNLNERPAGV